VANTTTANYGWQMPDPGGSANTWGNTLNATTQAVDAQVFANAQAGVPIGTIAMFGGATPPANWLLCQGQSLATVGTYAALFAVLQYAFGGSGASFNLPNLGAQFPIGAGINLQGVGTSLGEATGSFATSIGVAQMPPHAHPIVDVAHNHGVNQWSHTHGDGGGHGHGASQAPHNHGVSIGGSWGYGYGPNVPPSPLVQTGSTGMTTDTQQPAVSIAAAHVGLDTQTSGISLNASGTGLSTTQSVGSGAAWNVIPPFVCLNFIIKYQ
jgi:microcystin-dependent protein